MGRGGNIKVGWHREAIVASHFAALKEVEVRDCGELGERGRVFKQRGGDSALRPRGVSRNDVNMYLFPGCSV